MRLNFRYGMQATPICDCKKIKWMILEVTAEEKAQHNVIRDNVTREIPRRDTSVKNRIASAIRKSRKDQGLSSSAIAKKARLSSATMVRQIEYGHDADISHVEAIVNVSGLSIKLIETPT